LLGENYEVAGLFGPTGSKGLIGIRNTVIPYSISVASSGGYKRLILSRLATGVVLGSCFQR